MSKLEIKTSEESNLWYAMRKELGEHSSYSKKKAYFPYKMDLWETEHKKIESRYREQIYTLNKLRRKKEKETAELEASKLIHEGAEALLMLKPIAEKELSKRKQPQRNSQQQPLRRSKRIAQQSK